MARGDVPWKAVAVGWAVLTAGLIVMLGVLLCYVYATHSSPIRTVKIPSATPNPWYVLQGSFVGANVAGAVRFDNSSDAHALTPQVRPMVPLLPPPVPLTFVWGLMRLDNFSFEPQPFEVQSLFVCTAANMSISAVLRPPPTVPLTGTPFCRGLSSALLGQPSSPQIQLMSMGSFDVPLTAAIPALEMVEVVMVAQSNATNALLATVLARALLCSCNVSVTVASNTQQNFGQALGQYADATRFVMLVAILLALECALTLCLTWERRHHQFLTILLCVLIMLQDSMIVVYSSRTIIDKNTDIAALCLGLGPVFHLFVTSVLAWYAAATFNIFAIFYNNGMYARFSFSRSRRSALWYHVVCWSFVLVDFCTVWGLYAVTTPATPPASSRHPLSYGPVAPYAFCWIQDNSVLIGAFFAPALAVLAFSLGVTVVVSVQVCSVRCYHKRVNGQTVLEVISIFLTCSGGLIALVVLGTLLIIYADDPQPFLLLVTALLFLLQSVALWVVVFPRKQAMIMWALVLTCNAGQLQRKGSSLKDMASSNMFDRTHSTPLASPAASPPASHASGQMEL